MPGRCVDSLRYEDEEMELYEVTMTYRADPEI